MTRKPATPTAARPFEIRERVKVDARRDLGLRFLGLGLVLAFIGFIGYTYAQTQGEPGMPDNWPSLLELSFITGLIALPVALAGLAFRAPASITQRSLAVLGLLVCVGGAVLFSTYYPERFNVADVRDDDRTALVIGVYSVGLFLLLIGHFFHGAMIVTTKVERYAGPPAARAHPGGDAAGFTGRNHPVDAVPAITPVTARLLADARVADTATLIRTDPRYLAQACHVDVEQVYSWQSQADLLRCNSVDADLCQRMEAAGIYSVEQLSREDGARLQERLAAVAPWAEAKAPDVAQCVAEAKWLRTGASYPFMLPRAPAGFVVQGEVLPLEQIDGIGPTYAQRLSKQGIRTSFDLMRADPEELGRRAEVPPALIRRWQGAADLDRLTSMDPKYADLLARSGIRSVAQLSRERPEDVVTRIRSYLDAHENTTSLTPVDVDRAREWVQEAHRLETGQLATTMPTREAVGAEG